MAQGGEEGRVALARLEVGQQLVVPHEERRRAEVLRLVVADEPPRDVGRLVAKAARLRRVPAARPAA